MLGVAATAFRGVADGAIHDAPVLSIAALQEQCAVLRAQNLPLQALDALATALGALDRLSEADEVTWHAAVRIWQAIAEVYDALGLYDNSLRARQRLISVASARLAGSTHEATALVYVAFGLARVSRVDEALPLAQRAVTMLGSSNDGEGAAALGLLAWIQSALGLDTEAVATRKTATARAKDFVKHRLGGVQLAMAELALVADVVSAHSAKLDTREPQSSFDRTGFTDDQLRALLELADRTASAASDASANSCRAAASAVHPTASDAGAGAGVGAGVGAGAGIGAGAGAGAGDAGAGAGDAGDAGDAGASVG